MTVCFCIDDGMGISFNARRQSKDRILIERLCGRAEGSPVLIKEYSAKLFENAASSTVITDSLERAGKGDFIFVECKDPTEYMKAADRVIIYRWNRSYPADILLSSYPDTLGFSLWSTQDFEGSSHEKITEEIWIK